MNLRTLNPLLAHRDRKSTTVVDTIVMHATAGSSLSGAIQTLKERGLSYHYIIEKDGDVTKCVGSTDVAYHAGSSYGPHEQAKGIDPKQHPTTHEFVAGTGVNEYTIGICFVNLNDGKDPYTPQQMESAATLIKQLKTAFPKLHWLTTHYWVSPKRKSDPAKFDMAALAAKTGLTLWHR